MAGVPSATHLLHCWWCCHPWEGPDVHLPIKYDDRTKKFTTKGHFCSFECAKAWGMDNGGSRWGEILEFLALFRKHSAGKYVPTPVAPKRQTLKIFGGPLTIEEFRKSSGVNAPWVHKPGDVHMVHTFGKGGAPDPPPATDVGTEDSELKLKRAKPLKRTTSKLESALGIKRVASAKI
jgi:hypothetical protein